MGDRSSQFLSSGWQEALAFMFNGSMGSSMSGDELWSQTVLGLNPLLLCSVIVAQVPYLSGPLYTSHIPDLLCTSNNIWFVTTFMPGNLGSSETPTFYFSPFTSSNYLLFFDCLSWDCQHHKNLDRCSASRTAQLNREGQLEAGLTPDSLISGSFQPLANPQMHFLGHHTHGT